MKERIVITAAFILCFVFAAETLCAQDANYVVSKEAPEIEVYNHDGEVIGTLKNGDRVFVTMFHQVLPQADGSCSEPVTFIEYEGEEGYLLLDSPDWLRSLENKEVEDLSLTGAPIAGNGRMMRILALGSLALLLVLARPVSVVEWRVRDYVKGKGVAILTGVLLLAWCIISLYMVYLLYESGWFNTWRRSGFFRMVGNIFWMLLWFITQFAVLNVTVMGLAGMKQRIYSYFDPGMTSLATFVATWVMLIFSNWDVSWGKYVQIAVAAILFLFVCFCLRHVYRERGFISGTLILLVTLTGVPALCFVGLEALSGIMEILTLIWIAKFIYEGMEYSRFIEFAPSEPAYIDYYDPQAGVSRRLYNMGASGYVDVTDGSFWSPSSDGTFFNRTN